jgi:hypothetical protein
MMATVTSDAVEGADGEDGVGGGARQLRWTREVGYLALYAVVLLAWVGALSALVARLLS